MKSSKTISTSKFDLDGKPPFWEAYPLGLQQLLAMFVGNIVPMLIVSQAAGLSADNATLLLQSSILCAGVATLMQVYPIKFMGGRYQLGSGLPVMLGLTYTFLPISIAVAVNYGLGTLFGAQLIGAVCSIFVGMSFTKLRRFFPPIVTGTIVTSIGVSVFPMAVYNLAGGMGAPGMGALHNWVIGGTVIGVILALSGFGKGFVRTAAILIGMVVGYALAFAWGIVDLTPIYSASWFAMPRPLAFGFDFKLEFILVFILLFFINAVEMVGDMTVSATGGLNREPTDTELSGGIVGNSVACIFAAVFNCFPTGTYSQCSGIVALTKVASRYVMALGAGTLVIAALCPKIASILSTIPSCVIGGATIIVFSMIAVSGMSLIAKANFTGRAMLISGTSLALGLGLSFAKNTLALAPEYVQMFLGESSIILVAGTAILLNLFLPLEEADLAALASENKEAA